MNSVRQLVEREKRQEKEKAARYEAEIRSKERSRNSIQFNKDIDYIISEFNKQYFNINSSNQAVSKVILTLERESYRSLLFSDHERPKMVVFSDNAWKDVKKATSSSKYNRWKAALERKFGIKIHIYEDYEYERRFGNSGYETYPNKIFNGIRVSISFPK